MPPPSPQTVTAMLSRIGHRGPDEAGYFLDPDAALGNVRLSILDIGQGQQPMADETGRYWITYNGEVYNYIEMRQELAALGHRFRTDCDTEVVLAAYRQWGVESLSRLNGSFAIAILDRRERCLVLARDRYGKRPLFYTRHDGRLWFASEMKAFLAVPGFSFAFDPQAVATIFASWTPAPSQSGWQGIESLPMASFLRVDTSGHIEINAYEHLDFQPNEIIENEAEAASKVRAAIERSVSLRMRSDVPVGVYLSGGLDSAIVAAAAARLTGQRLSTFSVEFEDQSLDESPWQRQMAQWLGSDHHALSITPDMLCDALPAAVYHAEIPVFRTAFVPMFLLSGKVQAAGIKTILSGEGADEVFLGYSLFRETMLRRDWRDLDAQTRKERVAALNPYLGHFNESTHGPLLGLYQQYLTESLPGLFSHEMRFQNGRFALRLLAGQTETALDPLISLCAAESGFAGLGAVEKAQWLEFRTLLAGYLLSTQGERMGLAHGVENRCPFLDPDVVRLSHAVNLKFDGGQVEKGILKQAFPELPPEILRRHKHPYRAPDSAAFAAARPDYMELLLSESELAKSGLVDARFAAALSAKVLTSPPERVSVRENQAFILLMSLQLLQRQFVDRSDAPVPVQDVTPRLRVMRDLRSAA